jgi:ATP-dependent Clp protease ATP-binding subunit ClpA
VDKFLTELQSQLDEKRVTLHVDEDARLWLVEKGYDVHMGARPMERIIQESIKKPLAELVLFGELSKQGGTALVSLDKAADTLVVETETREELAELAD